MYEFDLDHARDFARAMGIKTRRRGDELIFSECPYCHNGSHGDKDKFSMNANTGQFKCMRATCNASGNMITLARDFGYDLPGYSPDFDIKTGSAKYRLLPADKRVEPSDKAAAYLATRGISAEVAKRYDIGVREDDDSILVIPFYNEEGDRIVLVKYRRTVMHPGESKEWALKDCKPVLFGMNHCDPEESDTLVLTEGQMDTLACAEAGVKNVVSVPTGANGFTWVPYCWDFLRKFKRLVVFGDHEHGRITLLDEMTKRFKHGVVLHVREEDYGEQKDANDILKARGPEAVRECVEKAVAAENPRVKELASVKPVTYSESDRFSTGYESIDRLTGGFWNKQLIVLTGERGLGKSTLASMFAVAAVSQGVKVLFYSGELGAQDVQEWFNRQVAGVAPGNINCRRDGSMGYANYSVNATILPEVVNWYAGKVYVYDEGANVDEQEPLTDTLQDAANRYGCRLIIVDNLMTAVEEDAATDVNIQQTRLAKRLKRLAEESNAAVILVAHPRKSGNAKRYAIGNDDISGSGNITNLADLVITYEKPPKSYGGYAKRLIRVIKNRKSGKLEENGIEVYFDEASKRISDVQNNFEIIRTIDSKAVGVEVEGDANEWQKLFPDDIG